MDGPTLIKIREHTLINPNQIVCIDLKGKAIFLSGTRYAEVSEEDLKRILEHCTVITDEKEVIPEIHPS